MEKSHRRLIGWIVSVTKSGYAKPEPNKLILPESFSDCFKFDTDNQHLKVYGQRAELSWLTTASTASHVTYNLINHYLVFSFLDSHIRFFLRCPEVQISFVVLCSITPPFVEKKRFELLAQEDAHCALSNKPFSSSSFFIFQPF